MHNYIHLRSQCDLAVFVCPYFSHYPNTILTAHTDGISSTDHMQHLQVYSLHSICIDLNVFKSFKFKHLLRCLHKRNET